MKRAVLGILILAGAILFALSVVTETSSGQTNTPPDGKTFPDLRPGRENSRNPAQFEDPAENIMAGLRPLSDIRRDMKEKLKISDAEKNQYKSLVGDKKAIITRILSAFSCSTTLVVDLSDPRCSENPGFSVGSYYSFRYRDYGESPWTDISLTEDELNAGNKWHTVGILADLGEAVEFGKLNSKTAEIKMLREFPPAKSLPEKGKQKTELEAGFTAGNLFLTSKIKIQANHVYVLRTISYRLEGGYYMFVAGFNWYNTDSLFVFKVVKLDAEKNATVAWRKISQDIAPVLANKEEEK